MIPLGVVSQSLIEAALIAAASSLTDTLRPSLRSDHCSSPPTLLAEMGQSAL